MLFNESSLSANRCRRLNFRDISVRVVKIVMGSFSDRPVVEAYKHSTIVNYDCKVHTDCRFLVETTLEL